MSADGSQLRNLTQNPAQDVWSQWSPDGTRLIFRSDREGEPAFYTIDVDSLQVEPLTLP